MYTIMVLVNNIVTYTGKLLEEQILKVFITQEIATIYGDPC